MSELNSQHLQFFMASTFTNIESFIFLFSRSNMLGEVSEMYLNVLLKYKYFV